jgi:P-type E1-E2 ATPase
MILVLPEGLPLMKILALQQTMTLLNNDDIIIQQVDKVEKMACVKELCVDKTGTLTNNEMSVHAVWCED